MSNLLDTEVLIDTDEGEIIHTIDRLDSVNGVWIASHLDDNGIVLSTEVTLSLDNLIVYLRALSPQWIILNTCYAANQIVKIQGKVDVDIIVPKTAELDDKQAMHMASLLALEYRRTGSIKNAVLTLSPNGDTFQYYPSPFVIRVDDEISGVIQRIETLSNVLEGDVAHHRAGLVERVSVMDGRLTTIEATIQKLTRDVDGLTRRTIYMSFGIALSTILFFISLAMSAVILFKI